MRIHLLAIVVTGLLLTPAPAAGEAADGPIPSPEQGWPQWHGRWRDGISRETGLLQQWPEGGPKALWTAGGLGRGWSGPIITGGHIYIAGDFDQECYVLCLDSRGNQRWRTRNGKAWTQNPPGSRASCCYADGRLYHMNGHGRLACLDAETGKELWAQNVLEQFGGRPITWGLAEGVLVHEGKVFATPGGPGRQDRPARLDQPASRRPGRAAHRLRLAHPRRVRRAETSREPGASGHRVHRRRHR